MKRIRVSRPAERDLDSIWRYIAKESGSLEIADRLVESITRTFPLFSRSPEAGTQRDEIAAGIRGFPAGKYIIYYHATKRNIEISRILPGVRDQKSAYYKLLE